MSSVSNKAVLQKPQPAAIHKVCIWIADYRGFQRGIRFARTADAGVDSTHEPEQLPEA